jgi:RecA/RadA recombinase
MDRVRTYIAGMDEYLEGGIPRGFATLICGRPGSMKSSLAYSILYKNAIRDEGWGERDIHHARADTREYDGTDGIAQDDNP